MTANQNTINILKGVDILLKYEPNATFEQMGNVDVIGFGSTELQVSEEDKAKLEELGWFVENFYTFRWAYWI